MADKSTSELLEITTRLRNDYQTEAVEAAEVELNNRDLSGKDLEKAREEIFERDNDLQKKADEPLEIAQKVLFFVFFFGVIPWVIAGTFKEKGYDRKYKDAWKAMKMGFVAYIGFFILLIIVSKL